MKLLNKNLLVLGLMLQILSVGCGKMAVTDLDNNSSGSSAIEIQGLISDGVNPVALQADPVNQPCLISNLGDRYCITPSESAKKVFTPCVFKSGVIRCEPPVANDPPRVECPLRDNLYICSAPAPRCSQLYPYTCDELKPPVESQ